MRTSALAGNEYPRVPDGTGYLQLLRNPGSATLEKWGFLRPRISRILPKSLGLRSRIIRQTSTSRPVHDETFLASAPRLKEDGLCGNEECQLPRSPSRTPATRTGCQ